MELPTWLDSKIKPVSGKDSRLIGWIHSHVRNAECFFSSVDVHSQHILQRIEKDFFGLVVSIEEDGSIKEHDFYQLTKAGMKMP